MSDAPAPDPQDGPIPRVDVSALFGADAAAQARVDRALTAAACGQGMLLITGLPAWARLDPAARKRLLALFSLPQAEQRKLWRWNFDRSRPNVYRGWFPLQDGTATYKQGTDMGPDVAFGPSVVDPGDPLREATPMPPEEALPGWREAVRAYYLAMLGLSASLMRSIARGLALPQDSFDAAFARGGVSTLRLLHYPVRPADSLAGADPADIWVDWRGERRPLVARAHVDSGFMTLLAQDGVEGLQAQHRDGHWIDVPAEEGTLAVNFGQVLQRWTGGLVRATPHRVVGGDRERHSIPFFYEAAVDAVIAPLPLPGARPFEPFSFGDYLWATTTRFVEQKGIAHLRPPRGLPAGR